MCRPCINQLAIGVISDGCVNVMIVTKIVHAGTFFQPIAYTFPDGLQSVDGSNSTGGCQHGCIMMPIEGSAISSCDCPGTTPVSGVLFDGVIPSIDTTQRGWASELFVVNRNGQDSITIGFQFLNSFYLREVELALFNCPVQGIGISGIEVYSSYIFPTFASTSPMPGGTHNSPPGDNCSSLSIISIPVQLGGSFLIYFVKFLFSGGSSVNQLSWLYLGEISFSDQTPTSNTPTAEGEILIMLNKYLAQICVFFYGRDQ